MQVSMMPPAMPRAGQSVPVLLASVPVRQRTFSPQPKTPLRPTGPKLCSASPACSAPAGDVTSRFGRRVRDLRTARAMTQLEVAVQFGIDRTFISDVERGRKSVCLPTMEIFALGFGVSLSDLLRGI